MAQDFAKRKQRTRKAPTRKKQTQRRGGDKNATSSGSGLRLFGAGVMTGIFLCFLAYLGTLPSTGKPGQEEQQASQPEVSPPKPRFDFYTRLREQKIEVEVEPAADVAKPATSTASAEVFVLQAGSFRQREDADRRRAELLLLGLEPTIEETSGDNGRWHRVYLGPFESHSAMARARGLTANQDIDTLVLKRRRP